MIIILDLDYACFSNHTSLWYYDDDRELEGNINLDIVDNTNSNTNTLQEMITLLTQD